MRREELFKNEGVKLTNNLIIGVRLGKFQVLSKRDLGACKGTSLLGSGVESPLIFLYKKKKKK